MGVKGAPLVVNAVWLIDGFTLENGATRVVPGTHRSGVHPTGDLVRGKPRDLNESVEGEIKLTGAAGCCFVYNAHLWHGGTQNCTSKLRRAQHCFFGHSEIPSSSNVLQAIDKRVQSMDGASWAGNPRHKIGTQHERNWPLKKANEVPLKANHHHGLRTGQIEAHSWSDDQTCVD